MSVLQVAVVADTHLRLGSSRHLPKRCVDELANADVILHAGDVVEPFVLDQLRELAPLHAVLGNNDTTLARLLPETVVVELAGVRVGMIHDSGPSKGRAGRLRRRFPDCDVVAFGHSHIPMDEWVAAPLPLRRQPRRPPPHDPVPAITVSAVSASCRGEGVQGQRLFNPGSPTDKRMQPRPTMGVLAFDAGEIVDHRILTVD